jgi:hypothetical protein
LIIRHKIIIKPDSFGFKELQKLSKNCPGYKESIGGETRKMVRLNPWSRENNPL